VIVTIDGPAGSGKSSTARAVARRLGFRHLDSGAFYRALTYAALHAGLPPESWPSLDAARLDELAVGARPAGEGWCLYVSGQDVSQPIRAPEVSACVSLMARVPAVRTWLLGRLRAAARQADLVTDGRDMGTVVFPEAALKVFLVADPRERARRRLLEQGVSAPGAGELDAEVERLLERDRLDSQRAVAPLLQPADAVVIDTTPLSFEQQVEVIVALARSRSAGA
jgi:cytidylate kinase